MKLTARDVFEVVGLAALGLGLYGHDWRLSLIVCGSVVLLFTAIGRLRT